MDLTISPEDRAFEQEVYAFFRAEVPDWYASMWVLSKEDYDRSLEFGTAFAKKLIARRWYTPHWPEKYGGSDLTKLQRMFLAEAIGYFEDPRSLHYMGAGWVGSTLLQFANEAQQEEYLTPTANADVLWCQGFSEPNSGSDLASLSTRATFDGDDFVLNGQKIWTSYADKADLCLIGARTDPAAPKHKGISFFVMDMKSPGITARPITSMFGVNGHICEVFLDNVRVPRRNLLGEVNQGWYLMAGALDTERSGGLGYMTFVRRMEQINALAHERRGNAPPAIENPHILRALGERWIELEVLKLMGRSVYWSDRKDANAGAVASTTKVFSTEFHQRMAQTGMDVLREYGTLRPGSPLAPLAGRLNRDYLWCRVNTIAGGASEIQRNIIAQRILGLPRA